MKVIGFTGTQKGMTPAQRATVARLLLELADAGADRFVHGCCIGADDEAAHLARAAGLKLVGLPSAPPGHPKRATVRNDVEFALAKPLKRNGKIVRGCDRLIATPWQNREIVRSGTWATVRHADRIGKPLVIVWPDGSTADALPS